MKKVLGLKFVPADFSLFVVAQHTVQSHNPFLDPPFCSAVYVDTIPVQNMIHHPLKKKPQFKMNNNNNKNKPSYKQEIITSFIAMCINPTLWGDLRAC